MSKVMVNVDRYGNTSSASIPLALAQAEDEGRLKPGMLVLLVAFGAGFTWGARSSGGDRAAVPRPGRAEGRDGEGSRRAVSRPRATPSRAIDDALGVAAVPPHVGGPRGGAHPHPQRPARDPRPLRRGAGGRRRAGSAPVGAAAGHSLGEYSAYVAAGSLSADRWRRGWCAAAAS